MDDWRGDYRVARHHALHGACRAREGRAYVEGFRRGLTVAFLAAALFCGLLIALITGGRRPW